MKNPDCNDDKCRECPERDTCEQAQEEGEIHAFPLNGLLNALLGHRGRDVKYKQFCLLDENEIKAFNEMEKATDDALEAVKKAKLMTKRFHATIELKHNLFDKRWQVDKRTQMLEVEEEPKEKEGK